MFEEIIENEKIKEIFTKIQEFEIPNEIEGIQNMIDFTKELKKLKILRMLYDKLLLLAKTKGLSLEKYVSILVSIHEYDEFVDFKIWSAELFIDSIQYCKSKDSLKYLNSHSELNRMFYSDNKKIKKLAEVFTEKYKKRDDELSKLEE